MGSPQELASQWGIRSNLLALASLRYRETKVLVSLNNHLLAALFTRTRVLVN